MVTLMKNNPERDAEWRIAVLQAAVERMEKEVPDAVGERRAALLKLIADAEAMLMSLEKRTVH